MPGKVKVRVLAGRNLPVMDRSSDTTDAYVEVKLGQVTFKTEVFRKSLNPQWNSEWFRFEVDDQELQDEPLQIRLMDHDTYSANDAIGKVYVDLNPLLLPPPSHPASQRPQDPSQPGTAVMSGWLPVYDTMHGIRGEVNIVVKVELFSDFNRFRQSSCGVQFFFTPEIPAGYRCQNIVGFVEELVVNDDPEYQWIDKIRTPRASNEARQTLFSKLSGELQRRIGLKVLELGGNAVISYRQSFDLEGETGIVVRGLGSAVTLVRLHYETGGAGTTHSPSPLRELTNQREEEDLVLENIYAASSSPSHPLMPISVVHLPPHKLSTTSAPPACLWFPTHPLYNLHVSHSAPHHSTVPSFQNSPSQWLDLMVGPGAEGRESREGRGSRWVLRGLPLGSLMPLPRRKTRPSASLTQHPPVFMQRHTSMARPHPTQGRPKAHKGRTPKPGHHHPAPLTTHRKPSNHDSLDSLRAGLRRTAQRVMRLRVGLEKSQSFDTGTSHSRHPGTSHKGSKSMGRLLKGRSHSRSTARQSWSGHRQVRDTLASPDDQVEDWDLDSPDIVEVEGLEDEEDEEEEGPEVTCIEYSFKGVSAAQSDPTLNKSVFAKQQLAAAVARPLAPIQLVSSEEDDCSSGQASSGPSSPECQGQPALPAPTSGKQMFYISEDSLESLAFQEGDQTPLLDLPAAPCRSTSDSQLTGTEGRHSLPPPRAKSHSFGGQEKQRLLQRTFPDQDDLHLIDVGEAASHQAGRKVTLPPSSLQQQRPPAMASDDMTRRDGDHSLSQGRSQRETMTLPLDSLHPPNSHSSSPSVPGQPLLPAIAVTPSTPVLPTRSHAPPTSLEEELESSGMQGTFYSLPERLGAAGGDAVLTLPKASSCTSFTSCSSSSSSTSSTPTITSTVLPSPSTPPLTLSLLPLPPRPPLTLSLLPPPPPAPPSVSMENQELLESALDVVVCAKCAPPSPTPPSPRPASSLDLLAEVRPGSAPSVGSPKRHSARSRHTSGCYPPFVSRSPLPPEPDATPAPPAPQANGVVGGGPGGGGTATNSSPTHSGKLASPARTPGVSINRRSSDSDLSITPKGSSLAGSGGSSGGGMVGKVGGGTLSAPPHRPIMTQESFDLLEYPFLTMKSFPSGFILHLGGTVSARSVKLLDRPHTPEEVETRDNWWTQLRMEIRSHTRALACNVVLGYEEFTTISDEVIVLNATGTAAVISLRYLESDGVGGMSGLPRSLRDPMTLSLDRKDFEQQQQQQLMQQGGGVQQALGKVQACKDGHTGSQTCMSRSHPCIEDGVCGEGGGSSSGPSQTTPNPTTGCPQHPSTIPSLPPICAMCHVPYSETSLPFRVKISKCAVCRKGKVPDVLFTTLELPSCLPVTGIGCLIQARVARPKKDLKGELNAKEISDSLPFLEYELHKHLINKMKIKGMNALFGLRVRVTVGERLIVGVATATAVFLSALPPPPVPRVTSGGSGRDDERRRVEVQKLLHATIARNKECYGLKHVPAEVGHDDLGQSDTDESEDDLPEIDLSSGNKDTSVLELDDMEDAEMIDLLVEASPPVHLVAVTTQLPPGVPRDTIVTNLQMFTRVWRAKVPAILSHNVFNHYFDKILQSVFFKVRKLSPCIISGLQVNVELPEEDEIQISLFGMVLGQGTPPHAPVFPQINPTPAPAPPLSTHPEVPQKKAKQDDGEMIFKMEEVVPASEETSKTKTTTTTTTPTTHPTQPSTTTTTPRTAVGVVGGALSITPVSSFPSIPSSTSISSTTSSARSSLRSKHDPKYTFCHYTPKERYGVEITPLSYIPGARIESYLGNLNFFFIRESTSIKENGGLSGFMGSFVTEVLALVRAHVAALGGNAMIAYFMSECVLLHNPYKNQGQCLINVGGDVVQVQYNAAATITDVPLEE